ncbi:MAG TPA: FHA domain-containing protein, partial [Terriglobales bacterium]|nr:FHA domain-containing protein [Terriglobales bacterium]
PGKERTGLLSVLDGKTDEPQYVLSGKLTVIGKSEMASIKLKGWFAPKVAAQISKRDGKYFIAASEKAVKVRVNGADIAGQKELAEGDVIEVAGIKFSFGYQD